MSRTKREFLEDSVMATLSLRASAPGVHQTRDINVGAIVDKADEAWRLIGEKCPPEPKPSDRTAMAIDRIAAILEHVATES